MKDSPNLDLLRSLAVLCVVGAHTVDNLGHNRWAGWFGITGVCFFFVHTSLVLMFSLERDPHAGHFYVRRIFRLYPLWLVMVAVVVLFRVPEWYPQFVYRAPDTVGLLSNAMLTFNLVHRAPVIPAGWTLPVEMDMYVFLPLLFLLARRWKSVWPLVLVDAAAMLFAYRFFLSGDSNFFMCVPCFVPGVMAYALWSRSRRPLPAWSFPLFLLALIALNQAFGAWRHNWVSCLVLGLALPFFQEQTNATVRKVAHTIAKYSYGIYLTHVTALMVLVHALQGQALPVRLLGFAAALILPPVLLYHLVEEPMIKLGARVARRMHTGKVPRVTEAVLNTEPAP